MVREDLIAGAVSFLQDPSVASAPLEQRIAFLKSKNLTREEIDVSLQRVGSESVAPTPSYPPQQSYPGPPYPGYQNAYWQPHPTGPPPVPRRDWRDWFIMATVVGGVGYGAFTLAKRYVLPIIAPPTPAQLEQDKASIDASFDKAFALLDQLSQDTEELKSAEKARTERLDQALEQVESVIGRMKQASERRDDEVRRTNEQVRDLRDLIPKAIKENSSAADKRLEELTREMQSLKTLISNRVGAQQQQQQQQQTNGVARPSTQVSTSFGNGAGGSSTPATDDGAALSAAQVPNRSATASPYSARLANGRAKIPAWQMAAGAGSSKQDGENQGQDAAQNDSSQDIPAATS